MYKICYLLMVIVALSVLPSLTIQLELDKFREEAFHLFENNSFVYCKDMFIADHFNWKIYVPYYCSVVFGLFCSITGVSSVVTCLLMMHESRKLVSKETLMKQRNFTGILVYQSVVYILFIILPVAVISTLFYADIHIQNNGLFYLLMISFQGAINNGTHIIQGVSRLFWKKKERSSSRYGNEIAMWSRTPSVIVT
uniref:G_PROTEIN_RECEP_F1_2 domain-containing protein n=1 Tax=Caenorhabditis tropicalis TaxID=1561998 RepID=A0A1I7UWQ1_9PELO